MQGEKMENIIRYFRWESKGDISGNIRGKGINRGTLNQKQTRTGRGLNLRGPNF